VILSFTRDISVKVGTRVETTLATAGGILSRTYFEEIIPESGHSW